MHTPELEVIEKLYKTVDGTHISLAERDRLQIADSSFTYGEINPETFHKILQTAQPQPGEIFYDLGSGTGKAVFCAALFFDWKKCYGIEFLPALHQVSTSLLTNFLAMPEIEKYFANKNLAVEFINQDITLSDFSDADVVYLHATTFHPELWDAIVKKLYELKSGSRVIVNTKKIISAAFEKINEETFLMGWGESTVFTYIKK